MASRSEVMLPPAGSEARWREEVMPPSVGRIALKSISGRKAGEDHARSQCPEKHPGTQGPLRGDENSWRDYFAVEVKLV